MTLADFFCGAGLLREALASWRCVYANDLSLAKASMYQARFPGTAVHVADIRDAAAVAARVPAGVVLAAAGFPCTDLSSGGKRAGLSGHARRRGTASRRCWSGWAVAGRRWCWSRTSPACTCTTRPTSTR